MINKAENNDIAEIITITKAIIKEKKNEGNPKVA